MRSDQRAALTAFVAVLGALAGAPRAAAAALPEPQAGELRSTGSLVFDKMGGKKKRPGFVGEVRDPSGAVVATLEVGHKLEGATLHRDALGPDQHVSLGGNPRVVELLATSTGPAWRPDMRIEWKLSRKHGVSRGVGKLYVGGTLWRTDTVEVSRDRATHKIVEHPPGKAKTKRQESMNRSGKRSGR